jgi:outer membrane usher protein
MVRMQRSLPTGPGIGYRLAAGLGDSDRRQAAISLQNDIGAYTVEADQSRGRTSYRGGASGGVALLAGDAFFSRRINSSFAVVQVPGYADVGIYQDNQPVARTNARGSALIPRLRPYQINSLRIEQADLPMDARIDSLGLEAVPYLRSGLLLSFSVQRSRGAVFTIILDDGEPLPAGAIGKLNADDKEVPVGFQGRIYVQGLNAANWIVLTWRQQQCTISFAFPESSDPLPDLGTYTCSGVRK